MARKLTDYKPKAPVYKDQRDKHTPGSYIYNYYHRLYIEYKLIDELVAAVRYYKNMFNLTIRDLATKVNVSPATVSNDLNGLVREPARLLAYLDEMEVEWEFKIL